MRLIQMSAAEIELSTGLNGSNCSKISNTTMDKKETEKGTRKGHEIVSEYIPCEMFLENTGFFSPSSNRIKSIFKKEKSLKRKDVLGKTEEVTITITALHDVGLPSTLDQDVQ